MSAMDLVLVMKQKLKDQSTEVSAVFRSVSLLAAAGFSCLAIAGLVAPLDRAIFTASPHTPPAGLSSPSEDDGGVSSSRTGAAHPGGSSSSTAAALCISLALYVFGNCLLVYSMLQLTSSRPAHLASPYLLRSPNVTHGSLVYPGLYLVGMTVAVASMLFQMGGVMFVAGLVLQGAAFLQRVYVWWTFIVQ